MRSAKPKLNLLRWNYGDTRLAAEDHHKPPARDRWNITAGDRHRLLRAKLDLAGWKRSFEPMEVYEIRPLGDGGRVELSGPLGIVKRIEIDSVRETALHGQACAMGAEAVLLVFHPDGTLKSERLIPPRKSAGANLSTRLPWF